MSVTIIRPLTFQKYRTLALRNCLRFKSDYRRNVDQEEVDKFKKLSREWWDPNGSLKSLFSMNELRVPFIRDGLVSTRLGKEPNQNHGKPLAGTKV